MKRKITDDNSKGKDLTCNHCGHKWTYKGGLGRATCTNCKGTVIAYEVRMTKPAISKKKGR